MTKIVYGEINDTGLRRFFTSSNPNVVFNTEATVKLGVDLSKIRNEDVVVREDSVTIYLPAVEIINFSYPHEKYHEIYPISEFDEITAKNKSEKLDEYFRLAELEIRKNLPRLGLVEQAKSKTTLFLEGFLAQQGFQNIEIRFKDDTNN